MSYNVPLFWQVLIVWRKFSTNNYQDDSKIILYYSSENIAGTYFVCICMYNIHYCLLCSHLSTAKDDMPKEVMDIPLNRINTKLVSSVQLLLA